MSGSSRMSATSAMRLRSTLIGQVPSPTVSAARMQVCNASAASTVALKKPSSAPLSCCLPRNSPSRSSRLRVAEKDEKHRRRADPRHVGKQRGEPVAPVAVLQPQRRSLLEIGFRRGRERSRQQQPDQRIGDGPVAVAAVRAPHQHLTQPRIVGRLAAEIDVEAEPGAQFVLIAACHPQPSLFVENTKDFSRLKGPLSVRGVAKPPPSLPGPATDPGPAMRNPRLGVAESLADSAANLQRATH